MSFKSNCGFGKRKRQNNEFRPHGNVPCDSFDDAILITEQKKTRHVLSAETGASKIQTESESIFFERSEI